MNKPVTLANILHEITFKASRSSGAGGQHVNKVSSKVTLKWDVANSRALPTDQKELLVRKLSGRLTSEGVLVLQVQESRSQIQNKEFALEKLDSLLQSAFKIRKVRKKTKPTKSSVQKRIDQKRYRAETKKMRRKL